MGVTFVESFADYDPLSSPVMLNAELALSALAGLMAPCLGAVQAADALGLVHDVRGGSQTYAKDSLALAARVYAEMGVRGLISPDHDRRQLEYAFASRMHTRQQITVPFDRAHVERVLLEASRRCTAERRALNAVVAPLAVGNSPMTAAAYQVIEMSTGVSRPLVRGTAAWTDESIERVMATASAVFAPWLAWRRAARIVSAAEGWLSMGAKAVTFRVTTPWPFNACGVYETPPLHEAHDVLLPAIKGFVVTVWPSDDWAAVKRHALSLPDVPMVVTKLFGIVQE